MALIDKVFLFDVLNLYLSQSPADDGEIALASAFEGTLKSRFLVVLDAEEYNSLVKRLEHAEKKLAIPAGRPTLLVFPKRELDAQEAPHAS